MTTSNHIADPRLYLLLRNDMASMTLGRGAAQASHGTSLLHEDMHRWQREAVFDKGPLKGRRTLMLKAFQTWKEEGGFTQAFGTTIVLGADIKNIDWLDNETEDDDTVWRRTIVDPSYSITDGASQHHINVVTGLSVFGSKSWLTSQYGLERFYLWGTP